MKCVESHTATQADLFAVGPLAHRSKRSGSLKARPQKKGHWERRALRRDDICSAAKDRALHRIPSERTAASYAVQRTSLGSFCGTETQKVPNIATLAFILQFEPA